MSRIMSEGEAGAQGFSCWLKHGSEFYSRIGSKKGPEGKCVRPAARQNLTGARARLAALMQKGRALEEGDSS